MIKQIQCATVWLCGNNIVKNIWKLFWGSAHLNVQISNWPPSGLGLCLPCLLASSVSAFTSSSHRIWVHVLNYYSHEVFLLAPTAQRQHPMNWNRPSPTWLLDFQSVSEQPEALTLQTKQIYSISTPRRTCVPVQLLYPFSQICHLPVLNLGRMNRVILTCYCPHLYRISFLTFMTFLE